LEEFWHMNDTPDYAILSHTWEQQEVTFHDIADLGLAAHLNGFDKIKAACERAVEDELDWIWIDTCCIDKSSSAELSEAINSMFRWYKHSVICYAYLSDVPSHDDPEAPGSWFSKSRWFTRGWTLQELVAPHRVEFYNKDWTPIGCQRSLSSQISIITRIDTEVLTGKEQLERKSIAQKMSWASRRCTTRAEDMAYCLMGLFDVNMPLLYGEGSKAFLRLQEEILKRSNDQSLFAWSCARSKCVKACKHSINSHGAGASSMGGFLSQSPRDFEHSNHYVAYNDFQSTFQRPYSMTNMGLCIEVPLIEIPGHSNEHIALLACRSAKTNLDPPGKTVVGVFIDLVSPKVSTQSDELPSAEVTVADSPRAEHYSGSRFTNRRPINFKLVGFGISGSKPWVSVYWKQQNCELKARIVTLYVSQDTFIMLS
jgi:hypothetical protein